MVRSSPEEEIRSVNWLKVSFIRASIERQLYSLVQYVWSEDRVSIGRPWVQPSPSVCLIGAGRRAVLTRSLMKVRRSSGTEILNGVGVGSAIDGFPVYFMLLGR